MKQHYSLIFLISTLFFTVATAAEGGSMVPYQEYLYGGVTPVYSVPHPITNPVSPDGSIFHENENKIQLFDLSVELDRGPESIRKTAARFLSNQCPYWGFFSSDGIMGPLQKLDLTRLSAEQFSQLVIGRYGMTNKGRISLTMETSFLLELCLKNKIAPSQLATDLQNKNPNAWAFWTNVNEQRHRVQQPLLPPPSFPAPSLPIPLLPVPQLPPLQPLPQLPESTHIIKDAEAVSSDSGRGESQEPPAPSPSTQAFLALFRNESTQIHPTVREIEAEKARIAAEERAEAERKKTLELEARLARLEAAIATTSEPGQDAVNASPQIQEPVESSVESRFDGLTASQRKRRRKKEALAAQKAQEADKMKQELAAKHNAQQAAQQKHDTEQARLKAEQIRQEKERLEREQKEKEEHERQAKEEELLAKREAEAQEILKKVNSKQLAEERACQAEAQRKEEEKRKRDEAWKAHQEEEKRRREEQAAKDRQTAAEKKAEAERLKAEKEAEQKRLALEKAEKAKRRAEALNAKKEKDALAKAQKEQKDLELLEKAQAQSSAAGGPTIIVGRNATEKKKRDPRLKKAIEDQKIITGAIHHLTHGGKLTVTNDNSSHNLSYQNGLRKFENGNYSEALVDFIQAIEDGHFPAYLKQFETLYKLGITDTAFDCLSAAMEKIDLFPVDLQKQLLVHEAHYRINVAPDFFDFEKILKLKEKALQLNHSSVAALIELKLTNSGNNPEIKALCKEKGTHEGPCSHTIAFELAQKCPEYVESLKIRGSYLLAGLGVDQNFENGERLLAEAVRNNDPGAAIVLGKYKCAKGKVSSGIALIKNLVTTTNDSLAQVELTGLSIEYPGNNLERLIGLNELFINVSKRLDQTARAEMTKKILKFFKTSDEKVTNLIKNKKFDSRKEIGLSCWRFTEFLEHNQRYLSPEEYSEYVETFKKAEFFKAKIEEEILGYYIIDKPLTDELEIDEIKIEEARAIVKRIEKGESPESLKSNLVETARILFLGAQKTKNDIPTHLALMKESFIASRSLLTEKEESITYVDGLIHLIDQSESQKNKELKKAAIEEVCEFIKQAKSAISDKDTLAKLAAREVSLYAKAQHIKSIEIQPCGHPQCIHAECLKILEPFKTTPIGALSWINVLAEARTFKHCCIEEPSLEEQKKLLEPHLKNEEAQIMYAKLLLLHPETTPSLKENGIALLRNITKNRNGNVNAKVLLTKQLIGKIYDSRSINYPELSELLQQCSDIEQNGNIPLELKTIFNTMIDHGIQNLLFHTCLTQAQCIPAISSEPLQSYEECFNTFNRCVQFFGSGLDSEKTAEIIGTLTSLSLFYIDTPQISSPLREIRNKLLELQSKKRFERYIEQVNSGELPAEVEKLSKTEAVILTQLLINPEQHSETSLTKNMNDTFMMLRLTSEKELPFKKAADSFCLVSSQMKSPFASSEDHIRYKALNHFFETTFNKLLEEVTSKTFDNPEECRPLKELIDLRTAVNLLPPKKRDEAFKAISSCVEKIFGKLNQELIENSIIFQNYASLNQLNSGLASNQKVEELKGIIKSLPSVQQGERAPRILIPSFGQDNKNTINHLEDAAENFRKTLSDDDLRDTYYGQICCRSVDRDIENLCTHYRKELEKTLKEAPTAERHEKLTILFKYHDIIVSLLSTALSSNTTELTAERVLTCINLLEKREGTLSIQQSDTSRATLGMFLIQRAAHEARGKIAPSDGPCSWNQAAQHIIGLTEKEEKKQAFTFLKLYSNGFASLLKNSEELDPLRPLEDQKGVSYELFG